MPTINKMFGGSINLMSNALDLRAEKQGLIQSNIANMGTPGYKMQSFSFSHAMETAINKQGDLQRTHPRHIGIDPVETAIRQKFTSEERPVDLDEEMLKLAENQFMYELTTRMIGKSFEGLRSAIDAARSR